MERGIRRMEIFKEEIDYEIFLIIVKRVTEEYEAKMNYGYRGKKFCNTRD